MLLSQQNKTKKKKFRVILCVSQCTSKAGIVFNNKDDDDCISLFFFRDVMLLLLMVTEDGKEATDEISQIHKTLSRPADRRRLWGGEGLKQRQGTAAKWFFRRRDELSRRDHKRISPCWTREMQSGRKQKQTKTTEKYQNGKTNKKWGTDRSWKKADSRTTRTQSNKPTKVHTSSEEAKRSLVGSGWKRTCRMTAWWPKKLWVQ